MKKLTTKNPGGLSRVFLALTATISLGSFAGAVQAAYFEPVAQVVSGGYSAFGDSGSTSDLANVATTPSLLSLTGTATYSGPLEGGTLQHGYDAGATLSFLGGATTLAMRLDQSLAATASFALTVNSHEQGAFVDLSSVSLRIAGDPGEANGLAVQVHFAGSALVSRHLFDATTTGGYGGIALSVSRGNTVLGEYLWDVTGTGNEAVGFSFAGQVGETLTLSAGLLSGAMLSAVEFNTAGAPMPLIDSALRLDGSFTITPVPEPESWALLLAGLALVGGIARRGHKNAQSAPVPVSR